jgi:hypothetical protein
MLLERRCKYIDLSVPSTTAISYATSITVVGTDVYVAGFYLISGGGGKACYWKNGKRTDFSDAVNSNEHYLITVVGTDIYITGKYYMNGMGTAKACYWKNGAKTDLVVDDAFLSSSFTEAIGITAEGDNIYVVGFHDYYNFIVPCYWKNGKITELGFIGTDAITTSITVVKE